MKNMMKAFVATVMVVACQVAVSARAETGEVRIARQFGIVYLPLMIMEHDKLYEKHAQQEGLANAKAIFVQLGSPAAMNDALISGSLDFGSLGAPPLIKLWDKTVGSPHEVKGVASISSMPMILNTRNPTVHSIRDFTDKDKIAMNAAKVSIYAMVLEMAAANAFGQAHYDKLDPLTVSLPHPEGAQALISGAGEIDAHFTAPPYAYEELAHPGIHTVLTSTDVVGPHGSIVLLVAPASFRSANPKAYKATLDAFREAQDIIGRDKTYAAKVYLEMTRSKETVKTVLQMLDDKDTIFDSTPRGTMKYVAFMSATGLIKHKPASWKDLFFDEAKALPGT